VRQRLVFDLKGWGRCMWLGASWGHNIKGFLFLNSYPTEALMELTADSSVWKGDTQDERLRKAFVQFTAECKRHRVSAWATRKSWVTNFFLSYHRRVFKRGYLLNCCAIEEIGGGASQCAWVLTILAVGLTISCKPHCIAVSFKLQYLPSTFP